MPVFVSTASGLKIIYDYLTAIECKSCVPPDTIIAGDYKRIDEMEVGSHYFGLHEGTVNETFSRPYTGDLLSIKAEGLLPVQVTPDHPVLVRTAKWKSKVHWFGKGVRPYWSWKFIISEPYWKPANKIQPFSVHFGDCLVVPKINGSIDSHELDLSQFTNKHGLEVARAKKIALTFPINEKSAWLLGIYVAEGCNSALGIQFSFGKHETSLHKMTQRKLREIGYSCRVVEKRTATGIHVDSRILSRAFKVWCGYRALNKRIPEFILLHKDTRIIRSFLDGYLAGDGHRYLKRGNLFQSSNTVSKVLALQLQLLYTRLGILSHVRFVDRPAKSIIEGRIVNQKPVYTVHHKLSIGHHSGLKKIGNQVIAPIRQVDKKDYSGYVHNLRTDDGTYLVSNAVVHNCGAPLYHIGKPTQSPLYLCLRGECRALHQMNLHGDGVKRLALIKCNRCVPPDTIVSGHYLPIKDYSIGDECLGLDKKSVITNTFQREYNGQMLEIRAVGLLPFKITPEHPVLVVPRVRVKWSIPTRYYSRTEHRMRLNTKYMWSYLEPRWKPAKELKPITRQSDGDCLVMPRIEGWINGSEIDMVQFSRGASKSKNAGLARRGVNLKFPINETSAWLLGLYVAEGSHSTSNVVFNLGKHECELINATMNALKSLRYSTAKSYRRKTCQVITSSRLLSRAIETWCGSRAATKRIPDFILYNKNLNMLDAFYQGYLSGDGSRISGKRTGRDRHGADESMETVSKVLALQLQLLSARLGFLLSVYHYTPSKNYAFIEGRRVKTRPVYGLKRRIALNHDKTRIVVLSDKILLPVRTVDSANYNGTVSNLETTSHDYLVNNVVVHNCSEVVRPPNKMGIFEFNCPNDSTKFIFHWTNPRVFFKQFSSDTFSKSSVIPLNSIFK